MMWRWLPLAVVAALVALAPPGCSKRGVFDGLQREECRRRAREDPRAAAQPCSHPSYDEYERSRARAEADASTAEGD